MTMTLVISVLAIGALIVTFCAAISQYIEMAGIFGVIGCILSSVALLCDPAGGIYFDNAPSALLTIVGACIIAYVAKSTHDRG